MSISRKNLQAKRRRQRRMRGWLAAGCNGNCRFDYMNFCMRCRWGRYDAVRNKALKGWTCRILPPTEHHMWTPEGNITFPINPPTP